jgi:4-hydroxy-2-oxoheptanedioate aldolase
MRPNAVKQLWRDDQPAFGAWLSSCSTFAAEQMASAGFDWLVVDGEHSPVDLQTMVQMFQAISTSDTIPMARVHWNDPVQIKRILDGGAYGVVIPWVNTRAEAEQAVAACRYPPEGQRGFGPWRGALYGGSDYVQHANEEIACIVQIETVGAVERIDQILSVPGIDATMIGPADLAMDMGIPVLPDNPHEDHRALCNAVLEACQKHGVAPGIFTSGPAEGKRRAEEGWRYLAIGSDSQYMMQGAASALRTVRG